LKAKILVDRERYTGMQIDRSGGRIYISLELFNDGRNISLTIIGQKAMEQEITANDMWQALQKDGFMALYINFDTNKATIKPESAGIIDQIVELMKSQPHLKLSIEGHTIHRGHRRATKPYRLTAPKPLSKQFPKAHRCLTHERCRMGQEKPVADNRKEEGAPRTEGSRS